MPERLPAGASPTLGPVASCRPRRRSVGFGTVVDRDVGQVAKLLGGVEPVADDEPLGDGEAHVTDIDRIDVGGLAHEQETTSRLAGSRA
jgi:hypothetical protein